MNASRPLIASTLLLASLALQVPSFAQGPPSRMGAAVSVSTVPASVLADDAQQAPVPGPKPAPTPDPGPGPTPNPNPGTSPAPAPAPAPTPK